MTINQPDKKDPRTKKIQAIIDKVSTIVAYLEALPKETRKNSKVDDAVYYALSYSGNVLKMIPEDSLDKINLPADEKAAFIQSYNLHKIMRTLLTQPKNVHVEDITSPELFIQCFKTGYGSSIINAYDEFTKDPRTKKIQTIIDKVSTIVAYLEALPEETRKNSKVNDAVYYALSYSGNALKMIPEDNVNNVNLPADEKATFIQSYNLHKIMKTLLTQPKNVHVEDITSPELFIQCFKTGYGSSIINAYDAFKKDPQTLKMQSIIDNVSTIVAYLEALPEETRKNSKVNDAVYYALSYSGNALKMIPEDNVNNVNLPADEKATFIQSYNLHKIMRTLLTQPKNVHVEDITSPALFIKCFKTGYGSSIINAWKSEKNQPCRISSHSQNVASTSKRKEKTLTRA